MSASHMKGVLFMRHLWYRKGHKRHSSGREFHPMAFREALLSHY